MQVAKVIGNIWATRKDDKLSGLKLLLVKPVDVLDETADKTPLVAADTIGAGVGETVIVVRKFRAECGRRCVHSGGCNSSRDCG